MVGEMAEVNLMEEQQKYCITQCRYGKEKMIELLHTCDSIFDAVADMEEFTQSCLNSPKCVLERLQRKDC